MSLLRWNQKKVQNLTPLEIWMFILGRGFMSFGVGVVAMQYWPGKVSWLGLPTITLGSILFILAAKGLVRKSPDLN